MFGLVLFLFFLSLYHFALPRVSSWDEVDFSLGVLQFDLLLMQPHFPGYPYFILGGMVFHTFIESPILSLVFFNITLLILSTIPMFLIAQKLVQHKAIWLVAIVTTLPYSAVILTQPMSEGAAMAVLWWYIWSIAHSRDNHSNWKRFLPALFLSLLLGIRLSYLPFAIGLLWVWMIQWKRSGKWSIIFTHIIVAAFFQCVWVAGLIWSEGSIESFFSLALSFVEGHFSDWGGAATADESRTLMERMFTLIVHNIFWTGIAAQSPILLGTYSILIILPFVIGNNQKMSEMEWIIILMAVSYFIWALFAQNIDKPRHSLPIISLFTLWWGAKGINVLPKRIGLALTTILVSLQLFVSYALLDEQYRELPAVHQLMEELEQIDEPFIIYTWEETRVMEYYDMPFEHKRILSYPFFLHDLSYYDDRTIYLTNHVIEGFKKQGVDVSDRITKVKEFSSNEIFDPVYSKIILYRWE